VKRKSFIMNTVGYRKQFLLLDIIGKDIYIADTMDLKWHHYGAVFFFYFTVADQGFNIDLMVCSYGIRIKCDILLIKIVQSFISKNPCQTISFPLKSTCIKLISLS